MHNVAFPFGHGRAANGQRALLLYARWAEPGSPFRFPRIRIQQVPLPVPRNSIRTEHRVHGISFSPERISMHNSLLESSARSWIP
jgi:hypothetical protein